MVEHNFIFPSVFFCDTQDTAIIYSYATVKLCPDFSCLVKLEFHTH